MTVPEDGPRRAKSKSRSGIDDPRGCSKGSEVGSCFLLRPKFPKSPTGSQPITTKHRDFKSRSQSLASLVSALLGSSSEIVKTGPPLSLEHPRRSSIRDHHSPWNILGDRQNRARLDLVSKYKTHHAISTLASSILFRRDHHRLTWRATRFPVNLKR